MKMIEDLALRGVTALENVNTGLGGTRELAKKNFHLIILAVSYTHLTSETTPMSARSLRPAAQGASPSASA